MDKRKLPFFKQHLRRDDRKRPQEDMHSKKKEAYNVLEEGRKKSNAADEG